MQKMFKSTKRTKTRLFDVLVGGEFQGYQVKMSNEIAEAFAVPADMMRGMSRPLMPQTDLMDAMAMAMELIHFPPGCLKVVEEYDS